MEKGIECQAGAEEAFVLEMDGPFTQKTGGKGANAAAAAGQTFACEFIGNLGAASAEENAALLSDLERFGAVDVTRCATLPGTPTGTAYILLFDDNDNAIILLGGANQQWPPAEELRAGAAGAALRAAVSECCCVMLQREVPAYVNVVAAELARAHGIPTFMDVGGTDAPLDAALLPHLDVIAPNESELAFISGVDACATGGGGEGGGEGADGAVSGAAVRRAVGALKAKCAAAGNPELEVLVTLGGGGSIHFDGAWRADAPDPAHETRVGCFPLATADAKPVDTTGAGDCFRGSYVAARYGEGRSVAEAMTWAAAASSLSVEVEGAMPSMPDRAAIEARSQVEMLPLQEL